MPTPELKQKLEVLLFMAKDPLPLADLADFLETPGPEIEAALQELIAHYQSPEYGIQVINISNGYQFATKSAYAKTLELYINAPQDVSLSQAAMETLVIIAYRQPISRSEVEAIRGVNADGIMKSLQDKGLIEEKGRSEAIGRPTLYGTTDSFLKHFGLKDLTELPPDPLQKMQNSKALLEKLEKFSQTPTEKLEFEEAPEAEAETTADETAEETVDDDEPEVIQPYTISSN